MTEFDIQVKRFILENRASLSCEKKSWLIINLVSLVGFRGLSAKVVLTRKQNKLIKI
jgi:hypothetical protein